MEVDKLHAAGKTGDRHRNSISSRPLRLLFCCVLDERADVALDYGSRPRRAATQWVGLFAGLVGQLLSRWTIRNSKFNSVSQFGEPLEEIICIESFALVA